MRHHHHLRRFVRLRIQLGANNHATDNDDDNISFHPKTSLCVHCIQHSEELLISHAKVYALSCKYPQHPTNQPSIHQSLWPFAWLVGWLYIVVAVCHFYDFLWACSYLPWKPKFMFIYAILRFVVFFYLFFLCKQKHIFYDWFLLLFGVRFGSVLTGWLTGYGFVAERKSGHLYLHTGINSRPSIFCRLLWEFTFVFCCCYLLFVFCWYSIMVWFSIFFFIARFIFVGLMKYICKIYFMVINQIWRGIWKKKYIDKQIKFYLDKLDDVYLQKLDKYGRFFVWNENCFFKWMFSLYPK